MSHLEWTSYAKAYPDMQKADGPEGNWRIKQSEVHVAYASYQLPRPEGEAMGSLMKALPDPMDYTNPDHLRLWHQISHQDEICYVPTTDLLKDFIENIRSGPKNSDKTPSEILLAGGFKKNEYTVGPKINPSDVYSIKVGTKGSITVVINDEGISATYDGKSANYWTNLINANVTSYTYDNKPFPIFWPEGSDPIRTGAEFVVDVLIAWCAENNLTRRATKDWKRPQTITQ